MQPQKKSLDPIIRRMCKYWKWLVTLTAISFLVGIKYYFLYEYGIYPWNNNDGVGYVAYAEQLKQLATWFSVPDYDSFWQPITIFRMPGYPIIILIFQIVFGEAWHFSIVFFQLIISGVAGYVLYKVSSDLSGSRLIGLLSCIIYSISNVAVFERYALTDSLYVSLLTIIICYCTCQFVNSKVVNVTALISIGICLGVLFLIRDFTFYLLPAFLILIFVWIWGGTHSIKKFLNGTVLVTLPLLFIMVVFVSWNYLRVGHVVLTTGAQTGALWTLAKVEESGESIFNTDSSLDIVARKHFSTYEFSEIAKINEELFDSYGMKSVDIARAATSKYFEVWFEHTEAMQRNWHNNWSQAKRTFFSPFIYEYLSPIPRDWYSFYSTKIFIWCLWIPVILFFLEIITFNFRKDLVAASILIAIVLWLAFSYSAIHMELRYMMPAIAPMLLVFSLFFYRVGVIIISILMFVYSYFVCMIKSFSELEPSSQNNLKEAIFTENHKVVSIMKANIDNEISDTNNTEQIGEQSKISVIIPMYNEADNVRLMCENLFNTLRQLPYIFEVIAVNDGSKDSTQNELLNAIKHYPELKAINLRRNYGQTAALMAGIDYSSGDVIVLIDADLQNDPQDIPRLIDKLNEGYDVVSGWRKDRKDNPVRRNFVSRVANRIISVVSGVYLRDYGCTLKAYRSDVIKGIRLYGEMHRFIPIYAYWMGARVTEIEVQHHARQFGKSKYGLERTFKVILDLLVVKFIDRYFVKPIYVFGGFGLLSFFVSTLCGGYMFYLKWFEGVSMILTPLPQLAAMTFLVGVMSILMGLLAEIMVRTYFESQGRPAYLVHDLINLEPR